MHTIGEQQAKDETKLIGIVKCIDFCGRQNLALRRHRNENWDPASEERQRESRVTFLHRFTSEETPGINQGNCAFTLARSFCLTFDTHAQLRALREHVHIHAKAEVSKHSRNDCCTPASCPAVKKFVLPSDQLCNGLIVEHRVSLYADDRYSVQELDSTQDCMGLAVTRQGASCGNHPCFVL